MPARAVREVTWLVQEANAGTSHAGVDACYGGSAIDQGPIVAHKRLGHVLALAAQVQAPRDSRQQAGPSRTLAGAPPRPAQPSASTKRQRQINRLDLGRAMAAAPIQQKADILTLHTANPPPHPGLNSVTSGQHHHLMDTPNKHPTPHKKHARADI